MFRSGLLYNRSRRITDVISLFFELRHLLRHSWSYVCCWKKGGRRHVPRAIQYLSRILIYLLPQPPLIFHNKTPVRKSNWSVVTIILMDCTPLKFKGSKASRCELYALFSDLLEYKPLLLHTDRRSTFMRLTYLSLSEPHRVQLCI